MSLRLGMVLLLGLVLACGDDDPSTGDEPDASARDAGSGVTDGGTRTDADTSIDASSPEDAGAALPDATVAEDLGPVDGGPPPLPESCTTDAECGSSASCDTELGRCVCDAGRHACGASCCPWDTGRDIELASSGADPEIGSDAAGNVYVLFRREDRDVVLATLAPGATEPTLEIVATSTGETDPADLAVARDGTILVAVHEPGGGSRAALFQLYTRAPGASTFTPMSLLGAGLEAFAYAAGVSLGRAPNGNIYGIAIAKSGDGQSGFVYTSYDATLGAWASRRLFAFGHTITELFPRDDGFFLRSVWREYDRFRYVAFDGTPGWSESRSVTSTRRSRTTGALVADGSFYWLFENELGRDGSETTEAIPSAALPRGSQRASIDMALDQGDNPVVVFHRTTSPGVAAHVGVTSRMPGGGWTPSHQVWPEAFLVPFPEVSERFDLDAEPVPGGYVGIAGGDSRWDGPLRYVELR